MIFDAIAEAIWAAVKADAQIREEGVTGESPVSRRDKKFMTAVIALLLSVGAAVWMYFENN